MPVVASHDAAWALICIDCAGSASNYRQNWGRFFSGGALRVACWLMQAHLSLRIRPRGAELKVNECLGLKAPVEFRNADGS